MKELGRDQATAALINLLKVVSVATLDQETILKAIALGWRDFEDAMQVLSANDTNADYLITRNTSDFEGSPIPVVTPSELLAILRSQGPLSLQDSQE
jgi:hypothetical protein